MNSLTRISATTLSGVLCLALCSQATAHPTDDANPVRLSSLGLNAFEATAVLLRDVCLAGILDDEPIADLAEHERALPVAAKSYGGGANDKAYRLGPITTQVYVIAWADGSCSTKVDSGDSEKLSALAERLILARPEGFVRGSHTSEDGGRVKRTVYCALSGPERLVATITTPSDKARRGTMALSSTVYRARGGSALCEAEAGGGVSLGRKVHD